MDHASLHAPTRKDRFIARLVSLFSRALYRDIAVHWVSPPGPGPRLWVANHFGGLADAIVLLAVMPRRPGIIARDVIFNIPVAGRLMRWIGGIPVHKPDDGHVASANDQMFASCYSTLAEGDQLLIFPEGVTRNEPSIAEVKTGAARIALGARANGAEGLVVAPVGIHYEDKAALRSRIVVIGGVPLDIDRIAETVERSGGERVTAGSRAVVRDVTDDIDAALRRSAPDYADWNEAHALTSAAEVTLGSLLDDPAQPVPVELRDRLANVLADESPERRAAIASAASTYRDDLDGVGLDATGAQRRVGSGGFTPWILGQIVLGLLLLPFALVGALVNFVPFLIVKAVGRLRVAPSVLSSLKPAVALVSFGLVWGAVVWWASRAFGIAGALASIVLLPFYFATVVFFTDRAIAALRALRRRRGAAWAAGLGETLAAERAAVVAEVFGA